MKVILSAEEKTAATFLIGLGKKNSVTLSDGTEMMYMPAKDTFSLRVDYPDGVQCNQWGPKQEALRYLGLVEEDSDEW